MREIEIFAPPPYDKEKIVRYMRIGSCREEPERLDELIKTADGVLSYQVSYCKLSFTIYEDICDFGDFSFKSRSLSECLLGCRFAVIFLASVGHGIDRLIMKHSRTSPYSASVLQAIGTERVEALCDAFCESIASRESGSVTRRFSPGYGDLALDVQRDIFALLAPETSLGVYLNESLFMSPSKSVTAVFGIR